MAAGQKVGMLLKNNPSTKFFVELNFWIGELRDELYINYTTSGLGMYVSFTKSKQIMVYFSVLFKFLVYYTKFVL